MIELRSASESSLPAIAGLHATSMSGRFAGAEGPRELARRLAIDAIDLGASWIASRHHEDVGIALVARRGGFARIDTLGVVPAARNQGVGRALLDAVLAGSRAAGDVKVLIEIPNEAEAAIRLCESAGFHSWRRLVGWERNHPNVLTKEPSRTVVELPLRHAAWACARNAEKDLPWPLAPESIANLTPPYRAFEHDHSAYCIVRRLDDGAMRVRALIVRTDARRRGLGSAVLAGAARALQATRVVVPSTCPEGLWDDFFRACGFQRAAEHHVELRRAIEKVAAG